MSDLVRAMQEKAVQQTSMNETLTGLFVEHFRLREEDKQDAAYMAYGMLAVDVAMTMVQMFMNAKRDKGVLHVMTNLTFRLNANRFWQQGAPVLVPIMQACLNAATDSLFLQAERLEREVYQNDSVLIDGARVMPLEIFPMIAFLLGGTELMQECSVELKRDLAPYLLS